MLILAANKEKSKNLTVLTWADNTRDQKEAASFSLTAKDEQQLHKSCPYKAMCL